MDDPMTLISTSLENLLPHTRPNNNNNDVFADAFRGHGSAGDSAYQPSVDWLMELDTANYDVTYPEQIPRSCTASPGAGQPYTWTESSQFSSDFDSYATELQWLEYGDKYQSLNLAVGDQALKTEGYGLFRQGIEDRYNSKRQAGQHNTSTQTLEYNHSLPTPISQSISPPKADVESSSTSGSSNRHNYAEAVDVAFEPCSEQSHGPPQATEERVIKRRKRKRKPLTEEEKQIKREAFLSRNRQAANKCRSKKRSWTAQLQEDVRLSREKNDELRHEYQSLMQEVQILKQVLTKCNVEHDGLVDNRMRSISGAESDPKVDEDQMPAFLEECLEDV